MNKKIILFFMMLCAINLMCAVNLIGSGSVDRSWQQDLDHSAGFITIEPVEIREEFEYPVEAYRTGWEGDLYFQIFLDFSGEVVDYILKIRSESEDINREASEAVESMVFDPLRVPQEQQESWMVYKFQVRKPDHIR